MSERVIRSDAGGVCTLTLSRPDKLNALDTLTFQELDGHFADLEKDEGTIGCVVLRGAGRAFCAGADLKVFNSRTETAERFKPGVIERLGLLKQPVVAGIHGICYTGGLELALAADLIVADGSARFADTHGKWGFVGAWGMTQRLSRRIGVPAAKRMMMTSLPIDAAEAKGLGLVDVLAPEGKLDEVLKDLVAAIIANSWHTNFATKRLMTETDGMSLAEGLAHEHYRYPGLASDYQERIASFTKKS